MFPRMVSPGQPRWRLGVEKHSVLVHETLATSKLEQTVRAHRLRDNTVTWMILDILNKVSIGNDNNPVYPIGACLFKNMFCLFF